MTNPATPTPPTIRTPLSEIARGPVRAAIRDVFPDCPDGFIDSFLELVAAPTDEIAARAHLVLPKPYGRNHILCSDGAYGVSFAWMLPGQTTSLHTHTHRREWFLVRCGQLTLRTPPASLVLGPGDHGTSVPGQAHALTNRGQHTVEFLEIFAPPLLDDKIRISDPYDRATGPVGRHE